MKRLLPVVIVFIALFGSGAYAQESARSGARPDDRVMFDISAEDWVATGTAHVTVAIEAAVTASTAGATRAEMTKAVNDIAKGDWRLTSFNRNQNQAGLEHWSALFEARLPESELGGLGDSAKKLSRAGLQISVSGIDFTPTLEEMEAARANLRLQIYKIADNQLATINATLPGRNYRIALVNFTGDDNTVALPQVFKGRAAISMMAQQMPMAEADTSPSSAPVERSQKVSLTARIVFAASEDKPAAPMQAPRPAPAPAAPKN